MRDGPSIERKMGFLYSARMAGVEAVRLSRIHVFVLYHNHEDVRSIHSQYTASVPKFHWYSSQNLRRIVQDLFLYDTRVGRMVRLGSGDKRGQRCSDWTKSESKHELNARSRGSLLTL